MRFALSVLVLVGLAGPAQAQAVDAGVVIVEPFVGEPATDTSTAAPADSTAPTASAGGSAVPATTPAPAVPDPEADTAGFFKLLLDAATTGKWKVLAGLVLVGLVAATRRWVLGKVAWFQTKLGGIALALGLSLAGTFGLALASGAAVTAGVVLNALSTAVAAAGLWQWLQSAAAKRA